MALNSATVSAAFPDLKILRALDPGGFKTPFLVESPNGTQSVLKIFSDPVDPASPTGMRSARELRLLDTLDYPHIAKKIGDAQEVVIDGVRHLTYQETFAANGTMKDLTLPVNPARGEKWFLQLIGAIEHMGQHGVVHRDLKPGNVGLTAADDVLILDLGIALDVSDTTITKAGFAPFTLAYAAPEQLSPRRISRLDHRADQYSVGVMINELIGGDVAADANDWPQDARMKCIRAVVERMMGRSANQRYRKPQQIADAIGACP